LQTRDTVVLASGYMVPKSGEEEEEDSLEPALLVAVCSKDMRTSEFDMENRLLSAAATNKHIELLHR